MTGFNLRKEFFAIILKYEAMANAEVHEFIRDAVRIAVDVLGVDEVIRLAESMRKK